MTQDEKSNSRNCLNEVMTGSEVAALHDVSPQTIRRMCSTYWLSQGKARRTTAGVNNWLIDRETAMRYRPKNKAL